MIFCEVLIQGFIYGAACVILFIVIRISLCIIWIQIFNHRCNFCVHDFSVHVWKKQIYCSVVHVHVFGLFQALVETASPVIFFFFRIHVQNISQSFFILWEQHVLLLWNIQYWGVSIELIHKSHNAPVSHNAPFRTEMWTFLFWMVHCGLWGRCTVGNVIHSHHWFR